MDRYPHWPLAHLRAELDRLTVIQETVYRQKTAIIAEMRARALAAQARAAMGAPDTEALRDALAAVEAAGIATVAT